MLLTSPLVIKNLFKDYNLWAKKGLGQHFLVNQNILEKIIKAANLSKEDTVLEIGSGIGTLTIELSKNAKRIIAIEVDKDLVEMLKKTLENINNVEVINEDILKFLDKFQSKSQLQIIGNIPYKITSPLLEKLLISKTLDQKIRSIILMVQKEVAQRICSKPPQMNRLSILVQFYGEPEIISYVSKNYFWPIPEVDSAILKIKNIGKPMLGDLIEKEFFRMVKYGFASKRKTLVNNLSAGYQLEKKKIVGILRKIGLNENSRAQELSIQNWMDLCKRII